MNRETYDHIRSAFEELNEISDSSLRTVDADNVVAAEKQLAWSLVRWGDEYDRVPAEAAALHGEDGPEGACETPTDHRWETVTADAKGYGSLSSNVVQECQRCGGLRVRKRELVEGFDDVE